MIFFTRC